MSDFALFVSLGLLFSLFGALAAVFHRRLKKLERDKDRMTVLYIEQLQRQISAQQRDLYHLADKIEQHMKNKLGTAEEPSPYNQAIELIKEGVDAAEVATRCGISRSEAELIFSLYRKA